MIQPAPKREPSPYKIAVFVCAVFGIGFVIVSLVQLPYSWPVLGLALALLAMCLLLPLVNIRGWLAATILWLATLGFTVIIKQSHLQEPWALFGVAMVTITWTMRRQLEALTPRKSGS